MNSKFNKKGEIMGNLIPGLSMSQVIYFLKPIENIREEIKL